MIDNPMVLVCPAVDGIPPVVAPAVEGDAYNPAAYIRWVGVRTSVGNLRDASGRDVTAFFVALVHLDRILLPSLVGLVDLESAWGHAVKAISIGATAALEFGCNNGWWTEGEIEVAREQLELQYLCKGILRMNPRGSHA